MDTVKRKLLSDMCLMTGGGQQTGEKQDKLLNLHSRSVSSSDLSDLVTSTFGAGFSISTTSSLMNGNGFRRPAGTRHIPATPEKILDAPDFRDDFCKTHQSSLLFYFQFSFIHLHLFNFSYII